MVNYRPRNPIDEPYVILNKSVDLQQEKSEVAVIQSAMQVTIKMYNANKINAEQVRDNYNKYLRLLTVIKNNGDSNADQVIDYIKSLYQQSNIGN